MAAQVSDKDWVKRSNDLAAEMRERFQSFMKSRGRDADHGVCKAGRVVFLREDADDSWPTEENACTAPAVMVWSMVTPGIGRYVFRAELCAAHQAELKRHFTIAKGPFTPEGKSYQVRAKRLEGDGTGWELTIPDIGVTQCQWLGDGWQTAADYIQVQTGEHVDEKNIQLAVEGNPDEYLRRPWEKE